MSGKYHLRQSKPPTIPASANFSPVECENIKVINTVYANKVTNLHAPITEDLQAATKEYVDSSTITITPGVALDKTGNVLNVLHDSSSIDVNGSNQITLKDTTVTSGSYGSATQIPQFTVNQQGRITTATNVTVPLAPIDTVFGRTGAVVAVNGDYIASQITNIPYTIITQTNTQDALNQLADFSPRCGRINVGDVAGGSSGSIPVYGFLLSCNKTNTGGVESDLVVTWPTLPGTEWNVMITIQGRSPRNSADNDVATPILVGSPTSTGCSIYLEETGSVNQDIYLQLIVFPY
jgi:hypothetical protein